MIEDNPYAWEAACDYRLCESVEALAEYVAPAIRDQSPVALDWETTSLNFFDGSLHAVGLSVSVAEGSARYVPLAHMTGPDLNLHPGRVVEVLTSLEAAGAPLIWYHFKFDGQVCHDCFGWELRTDATEIHWDDAMIAVYLENSNIKELGLKATAKRLLRIRMREYEETTQGQNFSALHPMEAVLYACADADMTRRLFLLPKVQEAIREQSLIYKIERLLVPVIWKGIRAGVYLDARRCKVMRDEIGAEVKDKKTRKVLVEASGRAKALRDRIYALAGGPFDLDSPQQLGKRLVALGVPIEERTEKSGQVETNKHVLAKYAVKYPICEAVVQYRELSLQCRNYLDKLIAADTHFGPLVRFAFNTLGAPTGRMSAGGEGKASEAYAKGVVDLNVQSIPDHEKAPYLPNIRSAFVANDPRAGTFDWVWVSIDYSQIEMRVAANLSREPAWIRSFSEGVDIHLTNARLAYDNPHLTEKNKEERKKGKGMGFAVLFGASESTVAQQGGIALDVAKRLVQTFFAGAPKLKAWIDWSHLVARADRRIKTRFGRLRRLEEYFAPDAPRWLQEKGKREAVNTQVQGAAADVFKVAAFKCAATVQADYPNDVFQTLWVHDEVNFRVRHSKVGEIVPALITAMEIEVKDWPVKLVVDAEVGWDWGTLRRFRDWMKEPLPVPTPAQ